MVMMYGFWGFESMVQSGVALRQYMNMLSHAGRIRSGFELLRQSGMNDPGHSELPITDILP